jgi:shikimate 5-dehydrogenase
MLWRVIFAGAGGLTRSVLYTQARRKMWTLGNRNTRRATETTLLELVPGQSVAQQIGIDP